MRPPKRKVEEAENQQAQISEGQVHHPPVPPAPKRRHPGTSGSARDDGYYQALYATEPDFKALGQQYPDFGTRLSGDGQLDFTDPTAVSQLTKTLLKHDFGLVVDLPNDRLCPPIPNRHNYILWLKSLLDSSSYSEPGGKLYGLDIGTGACSIYPLLATAQRPWHFIATDIDEKSLEYARKNVVRNGLEERIRLLKRNVSDPLIPLAEAGLEHLDFVMTNPPFYESAAEMAASAKAKAKPPNSACTGAPGEMICAGGELAFVRRILDESLVLRGRVRWYTAMFGKLDSLKSFIPLLRAHQVQNWGLTEFVQGKRTKRWAIAWSFGPMRPALNAARGVDFYEARKFMPPVTEMAVLAWPPAKEVKPIIARLNQTLSLLPLVSWEWDSEKMRGVGRTRENVWSRAWRRKQAAKKKQQDQGKIEADSDNEQEIVRFGFVVSISMGKDKTMANLRWAEGFDHAMFESFGGFLKTALGGV